MVVKFPEEMRYVTLEWARMIKGRRSRGQPTGQNKKQTRSDARPPQRSSVTQARMEEDARQRRQKSDPSEANLPIFSHAFHPHMTMYAQTGDKMGNRHDETLRELVCQPFGHGKKDTVSVSGSRFLQQERSAVNLHACLHPPSDDFILEKYMWAHCGRGVGVSLNTALHLKSNNDE